MRMYATEGIVLKKLDVGEHDTLYSVYTKDYGKLRALARGIRKEEAKLRGHLELLSLSSVRFVMGRNGEKLIGATLLCFYERMRLQDHTLRLGAYMARRVDEECFPGERDPALWDLMREHFAALDRQDFSREQETDFLRAFDTGLSACLGHGAGGDES